MTRNRDITSAMAGIVDGGVKTADKAKSRALTAEQASVVPFDLPDAPVVEKPEAFGSRLTPSKKRTLDDYVYALKRKGYPVNQYNVLDTLVGLLEDPEMEALVRARLLSKT